MPFSAPIPLGGFGSELGTLDERVRALEQTRSAAANYAFGPASNYTVTAGWQLPAGYPSVTTSTNQGGGIFWNMGCNIVSTNAQTVTNSAGTVGYPYAMSVTLYIDGVAIPYNVHYNPTAVVGYFGFMWVTPTVLGSHLFQWACSGISGVTTVINNATLAIMPF